MNVISASMRERLLKELANDEEVIGQAADEYEAAKSKLELGLRRYIAMRDYITEQIGVSPYAPDVNWPGDAWSTYHGRYRFWGMRVGDAILELLSEEQQRRQHLGKDGWMSLDEVVQALSEGGLGTTETVQARAVNAAIQAHLKSEAIAKGRRRRGEDDPGITIYRIKAAPDDDAQLGFAAGDDEGDIDPNDLPF